VDSGQPLRLSENPAHLRRSATGPSAARQWTACESPMSAMRRRATFSGAPNSQKRG
jgi:hypothetical protein